MKLDTKCEFMYPPHHPLHSHQHINGRSNSVGTFHRYHYQQIHCLILINHIYISIMINNNNNIINITIKCQVMVIAKNKNESYKKTNFLF